MHGGVGGCRCRNCQPEDRIAAGLGSAIVALIPTDDVARGYFEVRLFGELEHARNGKRAGLSRFDRAFGDPQKVTINHYRSCIKIDARCVEDGLCASSKNALHSFSLLSFPVMQPRGITPLCCEVGYTPVDFTAALRLAKLTP